MLHDSIRILAILQADGETQRTIVENIIIGIAIRQHQLAVFNISRSATAESRTRSVTVKPPRTIVIEMERSLIMEIQ